MNQWEARLKQWGVTLIVIGLGSFVLPMIGLQFRLLNLFGGNPAAGIIVAAAGAALLALDFIKKRALSAPGAKPADGQKQTQAVAERVVSQPHRQPTKDPDIRCLACGGENAQGDQFCGSCGAALVRAAPPTAPNCGRCGAPLSPDERFCGECGSPTVVAAAPAGLTERRCSNPQCDRLVPARYKFCMACGSPAS